MNSLFSPSYEQDVYRDSAVGRDDIPAYVAGRRLAQRRQAYAFEIASYAIGSTILLIYAHAGSIPFIIPSAFFVTGLLAIGCFTVLSETGATNRLNDHFMGVQQVAVHTAIQLAFLIVVPQIGYAFLNVLFLIFSVGALSMSGRQSIIAWTLTALAIGVIFVTGPPIGMLSGTPLERLAATLCFILTIGQCAFVGIYGKILRETLYRRGTELRDANRRIEELAELDELTGAYNRRCIMQVLEEEIARARRSNAPLAIALIDLDWFKRINDTYGHLTGDEVLRAFAISMFANVRSFDKFGRYGGEEFLLVLPETSIEDATRMLDRLRMIVADLDWSAFSSGMSVTMSSGVTPLAPDDSPEAILARADRALYKAKEEGRNRIVSG